MHMRDTCDLKKIAQSELIDHRHHLARRQPEDEALHDAEQQPWSGPEHFSSRRGWKVPSRSRGTYSSSLPKVDALMVTLREPLR